MSDENGAMPNKDQSCHTKDLPDWAYSDAHKALGVDGEWCPHSDLVASVARALIRAKQSGIDEENLVWRTTPHGE